MHSPRNNLEHLDVADVVSAQSIAGYFNEQEEMIAGCVESVVSGNSSVQNVPIVGLVVNLALDALEEPQNQARIPGDISQRYAAALACVSSVVDHAVSNGLFLDYDDQFSGLLEDAGADAIETDPNAVEVLAGAPFGDVAWVGSGALAFLNSERVDSDHTAIIAGSTELQEVSRIANHRKKEAMEALGFPVMDPTRFRLQRLGLEVGLSFTEEALKIMRLYGGQGCPAHGVIADGYSETVFDAAWTPIVNYCIPPQATFDNPSY